MADSRPEARLKKYLTMEGSGSFQVMVFQPNSANFQAVSHLWICDSCFTDYGPYSLFFLHKL